MLAVLARRVLTAGRPDRFASQQLGPQTPGALARSLIAFPIPRCRAVRATSGAIVSADHLRDRPLNGRLNRKVATR